MKAEIDGLKDDLALDFARQVYGTGDGVIALARGEHHHDHPDAQSAEAVVKGSCTSTWSSTSVTRRTRSPLLRLARSPTSTRSRDDHDLGRGRHHDDLAPDLPRRATRARRTTYALREMDAGLQKLVATAANTVGGINAASAGNEVLGQPPQHHGWRDLALDAHVGVEPHQREGREGRTRSWRSRLRA
jgi:hypothetical protein